MTAWAIKSLGPALLTGNAPSQEGISKTKAIQCATMEMFWFVWYAFKAHKKFEMIYNDLQYSKGQD